MRVLNPKQSWGEMPVTRKVWCSMRAFILGVALALPTVLAHADAETSQRLAIGYTDFRPYAFPTGDGGVDGLAPEILRAIAADKGYTLSFRQFLNPGEVFAALSEGSIDASSLLGATPARDAMSDFSIPVGLLKLSLATSRVSHIERPEDIGTRTLGVVRGSTSLLLATRRFPDARLVISNTLKDLFASLLTGSVDAAIVPDGPFMAIARRADVAERVRLIEPALRIQQQVFAVSLDRPDILAALNAGIAELEQSGELQRMQSRWFGRDKHFLEREDVRIYATAGTAAFLALSIGGSIAWHTHRRANRSFAAQAANRLLVDALNGVDLLVVIYDRNLRAVHWNEAVAEHLPELLAPLERGMTFREIAFTVNTRGYLTPHDWLRAPEELAEILETQLVTNGRTQPRLMRSSRGVVFEAVDFKIGTDMYASVRKNVTRLDEKVRLERKSSEARFAATFKYAPVGIAHLSFDGEILKANSQLTAILRHNDRDLTGLKIERFIYPADARSTEAYLANVVDGTPHDDTLELRLVAATGEVRWANLTLAKIGADGIKPGYLVAIIEDISERKNSEQQRTLLLGELSHRVKNILAVVQSIVVQTLRRSETATSVRETIQSRLTAIAAAHDIVFANGAGDIATVLSAQFAPFDDLRSHRIALEGPHIELPVDLVYCLGLITHELATNAVKYGAFSNAEGQVHVAWSLREDIVELTWTESGGPPAEPPSRAGFGSRLVTQMIGHTRSGAVDFDFRPEGLIVTLRFQLMD